MALTLKSAVIALALFGGALGVYRYTQNMYIHNTDKEVISRKYEASYGQKTKIFTCQQGHI